MAFGAFSSATPVAAEPAARRRSPIALFLLLPGALYLALFFLVPLVSLVLTSLQTVDPRGDFGEYVYAFRWENYVEVMQTYWPHILRSFGFAAAATVFAQNMVFGSVVNEGAEVWLTWNVDHTFGLADDPAASPRFEPDEDTSQIATQRRERIEAELEGA